MRISELFDELDTHELEELLDLPVRGTAAVSARRVRRRVNRALDADPAERRVHMKQAYKKGICAALIAACLLTGAFAAVIKMDVWREWFPDGTGDLEINTEKQSIDNGDIQLTLEESIADGSATYVVFSLHALTEEGAEQLDRMAQGANGGQTPEEQAYEPEQFFSLATEDIGGNKATDIGGGRFSWMSRLLEDRSQSGELYFQATAVGGNDIYLTLRGTDDRLYIPTSTHAQTVDLLFDNLTVTIPNGAHVTFYSLRLTSLGYALDYRFSDATDASKIFWPEYMIFFLMDDGSIRSLAQQAGGSYDGSWAEVLDLDTVEAVILNDTAYYLDGSAPEPYPLPEEHRIIRLEPAPVFPVPTDDGGTVILPGIPARALLEPFGGTVEYDAATKTAVLRHRDYTCMVTVGSPVVQFGDGQSLTYPMPSVAEIVDGTLYLFPFGFDRTLGIYRCGRDYSSETMFGAPEAIETIYYTT